MYLVKGYVKGIETDAYAGDLLTVRKYGETTLLFKGRKAVIDNTNPSIKNFEFVEIPVAEIRGIEIFRNYGDYTIGRVGDDLFHLMFGDRLLMEADAQKMADYMNQCV